MNYALVYTNRRVLEGDLRTNSSDCNEIALFTQVVGRTTKITRRVFDELSALRDNGTTSSFEPPLLVSSAARSVSRVSLLMEVGLNQVPTIKLSDCDLYVSSDLSGLSFL